MVSIVAPSVRHGEAVFLTVSIHFHQIREAANYSVDSLYIETKASSI